jgi:micrococcal nuclease
MKQFLLALLAMIATTATAQVHIRDADTIVVDGTPVRLQGVDAPELKHAQAKTPSDGW